MGLPATLGDPTKNFILCHIFDISYEVVAWWPDGIKEPGVPFDNIKEHYNDYEKFLNIMRKIAEGMPN